MTAAMPERKDPSARALTENHTVGVVRTRLGTRDISLLTRKVCEVHGFGEDGLSNP